MSTSDVPGVAGGNRSAGAKGSIRIFDTTLRDGEQAPGASLTMSEKLEVARQLVRLNVDVIEAGFPAASPDDFAAVQQIAREVKGRIVTGLARAVPGDIDTLWEAVKVAEPRPTDWTLNVWVDGPPAAKFSTRAPFTAPAGTATFGFELVMVTASG